MVSHFYTSLQFSIAYFSSISFSLFFLSSSRCELDWVTRSGHCSSVLVFAEGKTPHMGLGSVTGVETMAVGGASDCGGSGAVVCEVLVGSGVTCGNS